LLLVYYRVFKCFLSEELGLLIFLGNDEIKVLPFSGFVCIAVTGLK